MQTEAAFQEDRIDVAQFRGVLRIEKELDTDLARRIRMRDQSGMTDLYDRYGTLAFTVIFRIVGDRTIAEDLTQETFLRVWTSIASFDAARGALRTWLASIARNKAIDYLRSPSAQWDRIGCELERGGRSRAEAGELIEDELMRRCATRLIDQAMGDLTARQQEVIRLAYFEGRTQADIANLLQAPLGSVKSWVRGGLKKLRESLAPQSVRLAY